MCGHVVLAHAQNLTNHRGDDMRGHFEHGPLTTFNYVKLQDQDLELLLPHVLSYLVQALVLCTHTWSSYTYVGIPCASCAASPSCSVTL